MGLYKSSSHVYWRCKYHIVWTPKYRFTILRDKLGKELYRTIYILCGIKADKNGGALLNAIPLLGLFIGHLAFFNLLNNAILKYRG